MSVLVRRGCSPCATAQCQLCLGLQSATPMPLDSTLQSHALFGYAWGQLLAAIWPRGQVVQDCTIIFHQIMVALLCSGACQKYNASFKSDWRLKGRYDSFSILWCDCVWEGPAMIDDAWLMLRCSLLKNRRGEFYSKLWRSGFMKFLAYTCQDKEVTEWWQVH